MLRALTGMTGRVQKMDRPRALRLGANLGRVGFHVARRARFTADRNLRLVHGRTMSQRDRDAFVRQVFEEFGKTTIDFLRGPILDADAVDRLVPHVEGLEQFEEVRAAGKGIVLMTAHLGNWELFGRWASAHGVPMTVVARDPEDAALGAYVRRMRENAGLGVLSRGSSARDLLKVLKKGEVIGLLPDQNRGDVFAPFFGVPCGTPSGPAVLALHTGAALMAAYCVREPDDTYRILCLPPLEVVSTGDALADQTRIMTEANAILESVVKRYPTQWLWLHDRWKGTFQEQNRHRLPPGYDYDRLARRRNGEAQP